MRRSDVARETGLSVSTIRYYERRSVIRRPNMDGGSRDYSEEDIRVLRFVRNSRSLGMPLRDIAEIVQEPWNKDKMALALSDHGQIIQARIDALRKVQDTLTQLETCACLGVLDCVLAGRDG